MAMTLIKVPSPTPMTVRDLTVSNERHQIRDFAKAIYDGETGITYDNAKTVLQNITGILEKVNMSMVNVLPLMFSLNQKPYVR
jgi:hypothetical protein